MSTRKLPKKVLMANLMAQAAAEASHDNEHRARFNQLIARTKGLLDAATDPEAIHRMRLDLDFSEIVHIAKNYLRMQKDEFEAAVSVLNTPISRVVNTCPSGKDIRDLPEWMLAKPEELRLSYRLMTHHEATGFIAEKGAMWGYTAAEIARAKKEHKPLEYARLAKRDAEDKARQEAETDRVARSAAIDVRLHESHLRRLAYEATNPPVPDYLIREREWLEKMRRPHDFIGVEVVFEDDEFSTVTPTEMDKIREADDRYLKTNAANMIREMEKLTEHKFDRRWKTKAELHSALRAHFKFCGYDEELDFRWLRFGAYTSA